MELNFRKKPNKVSKQAQKKGILVYAERKKDDHIYRDLFLYQSDTKRVNPPVFPFFFIESVVPR